MADEMDRIVPLDDLDDFEVAEGDPDVTGWDVIASDGRKIGEVDQLLVDTDAMKVRYLDVEIDEDLLETDKDRHVLIPIGFARLHEDDDQILVDNLSSNEVRDLPEYRHEPITREMESSVRRSFDRGFQGEPGEEEFYEHEHYDEGRFFGTRRGGEQRVTRSEEELLVGRRDVEAGEVDIEKHVETEHVTEPVRRRHEEVDIERRPVEGQQARGEIGEEEIHIPIHEEELVVEKRPVVKEEIVARKHTEEDVEEVEADLRKERVDIEEHGRIEEEEEGRGGQGRNR